MTNQSHVHPSVRLHEQIASNVVASPPPSPLLVFDCGNCDIVSFKAICGRKTVLKGVKVKTVYNPQVWIPEHIKSIFRGVISEGLWLSG